MQRMEFYSLDNTNKDDNGEPQLVCIGALVKRSVIADRKEKHVVPIYHGRSYMKVEAYIDSDKLWFTIRGKVIEVDGPVECGFNPSDFAVFDGTYITSYSREFKASVHIATHEVKIKRHEGSLPKYVTPQQWGVTLPAAFIKKWKINEEER